MAIYNQLDERFYFQQAFGYHCVDAGFVAGTLGSDIGAAAFIAFERDGLLPISENLDGYSEEDLFDVIEFLFDH
ncbi:MAG: hypothetical protein AB7M12_08545, partial [Hyphomonadaceae bacterium]